MTPLRTFAACCVLVVVGFLTWGRMGRDPYHFTADRLLLLVPDGGSFSDPKVTEWLDAGSEEGVHVVPVHDSDFLRPFWGESQCAGVILPDMMHQRASDLLVANVRRYVAGGGKLMLVYDAATLSLAGRYAQGRSRLSDLAGVDYALWDNLQDKTIQWSSVSGSNQIVRQLEIPPGKFYPFEAPGTFSSKQIANLPADFDVQLRRYKYGDLLYPSFVTSGNYSGKVLFHSTAGIVAGEHPYENGSVLFVNLPLGYLKANTDGLLLHSFLRYFTGHFLSLPQLMSVPDGVGGLILNWHVDSNDAIPAIERMKTWDLLKQGPYSIHITAGPDAAQPGDGLGFNVEHNPKSQSFIRMFEGLGYEVGSHGGWIHDYFADHVDKDEPKDLEKYLELNKSALEHVTGKPVVEYSAPEGNQPPWVTRWLEAHGFVAYYFTGNSGMAPTQGYRDGTREGQNIWAFPILHLNKAAAFEEMSIDGYSGQEVEHWLDDVVRFSVEHHAARLVYFHPSGLMPYRNEVNRMLKLTAQQKEAGNFRWYTMTELAGFLTARKQVKWNVSEDSGKYKIEATHPQSRLHETWSLPANRFTQPVIVRGTAKVVQGRDSWIVIAGDGKDLLFEAGTVGQ